MEMKIESGLTYASRRATEARAIFNGMALRNVYNMTAEERVAFDLQYRLAEIEARVADLELEKVMNFTVSQRQGNSFDASF